MIDEQIVYVHIGDGSLAGDTILLSLTDGQFTEDVEITVIIGNPITVISNVPLVVQRGEWTLHRI